MDERRQRNDKEILASIGTVVKDEQPNRVERIIVELLLDIRAALANIDDNLARIGTNMDVRAREAAEQLRTIGNKL